MAKKTLIIDGTDPNRFFLAVEGSDIRVGDHPGHAEGLVRNLRIVRIRCEVEVEEDRDHVAVEEPGALAPHALTATAAVKLRHAHLSLTGTTATAHAAPAVSPTEHAAPPSTAAGPRRLKVIDGGDQGVVFPLPETGAVIIGKPGSAEIGLHDLYVARVHCELAIGAGGVTVTHLVGTNGTLVDGQRITQPQPLRPGGILRVGNSHLRLEVGPFSDEPADAGVTRPVSSGSSTTHRPLSASTSGVMRAMLAEGDELVMKPAAIPSGDPLADMAGHALGGFQLGPFLGRGWTGAVYHATQTKTGQVVALKVLASEFPASQAELDRFAQALKAAHPVRHVNLVTPTGVGRAGSHCWIARELVDGESAAAVIGRVAEGEKPSWTQAARVTVHLARVLECLHEHRMVHGNITPRNVLLRTSDLATKLADLRLMQALEGSRLQATVLEKKLLAELPYLAPEQAEPGAFVDDLADLYAVGAVAYALITGRPPVTGSTPEEILERIHEGRVVRPSSYYKKVPAAFDAIVMKLLALRQEDRYPTAAALLADLAPIAEEYDLKA